MKRVKTGGIYESATLLGDDLIGRSHHVLYTRRWYILLIFSFLSINQSNIWITYGAVLETAKELYGVTDGGINLLSAMGPAGFIPLSFVTSWIIGEKGLRISCVLAAFLVAAGSIMRCLADANSFWMVIIAQVLNAAAGPVVMTAPPALSQMWFGANERTFATAIGSLANYLGCAVGFLLGLTVTNTFELSNLLFYEAVVSVVVLGVVVVAVPPGPPSPPSASAAAAVKKPSVSLKQSMFAIFSESAEVCKSRDGVFMLMSAGISSGVYGGWTSMLVFILGPYYSQWDIQWLGLVNIVAGVIGGILVGKLHDVYRHFKVLMIFFFLVSFGIFAVFSLATERIIICTFSEIMLMNIAAGFTINAMYPLAYEALIEITYPIKEEVSAGLIALVNNVACLVLLIVGNYKQGPFINWTMTGVCLGSTLLLLLTKETYKRAKLDIVEGSV